MHKFFETKKICEKSFENGQKHPTANAETCHYFFPHNEIIPTY